MSLKKKADPENHETLERLKRYRRIFNKWIGRQVYIWSAEHLAFWRPRGSGYTTFKTEAGEYDFLDAFDRTRHCDPSKGIEFIRVKELCDDEEVVNLTAEFREMLTAGRNDKPYDRERMREVSKLLRKKLSE